MTGSVKTVSRMTLAANHKPFTWGNYVSEGGLEPPCPFQGTSTSS